MPARGSKTSMVPVVWENFGIYSARSKWFPAAIDDHGRNLVISLWPGDKATINSGIAAHPAPKNSEYKNPLEKFSPRFVGIKTASSSLITFQKAKLPTQSITHLCWCNWRTFWKKNASGISPSGSCSWTTNPRALATQKKLGYLGYHCLDHPPYSPDLPPSDYHLFPGQKKKSSSFFVRIGCHCYRGDLVGRTTFWFFFSSGLQKLQQRAKKCIDLRGENVE